MPWAPVGEPSLGLAVLKAQLARDGIDARIWHANLGLLRHVTGPAYQQLASLWGLNEFTFSGVLDGDFTHDQIECVMERCYAHHNPDAGVPFGNPADLGRALIRLRHQIIPRYLAGCAEEILAWRPTMVGFTCMFDQTIAAAALALLVRRKYPEALIVLGGYALEGPPGLEILRAFPHIDAIAGGDGEPVITPLANASVGGADLTTIPGVLTRDNPNGRPRQKFEVDDSPDPDYADWFDEIAMLKARDWITIKTSVLPVESSRGCWWGQKQHCVFCGIDEDTLSYRAKKPATVLKMLATMRERYGAEAPFRFSDYILPQNYVSGLLPQLATVEPRYTLHCEIKANQNEDRVKAFAAAGFTELQPGIESFDSNVLRLMKKGVKGIQNVNLLKLGYLHGIQINYNILFGIPGEKTEWYRRMIDQMPRLFHLTPPVTRTETIVTRFAPLEADPGRFGGNAPPRHHRCYDSLFSANFLERTGFSLDRYGYYFERYYDFEPDSAPVYWALVLEVDHWKQQHRDKEVFLSWEKDGDSLLIRDTRFGECREIQLKPPHASLYLAVDLHPKTFESLAQQIDLSHREVEAAVEVLDRARLVWREDDSVLGLATPCSVVEGHRQRGWQRQWTSLYS
jgi:ribosomal peptide maturation radical SAM protein 1